MPTPVVVKWRLVSLDGAHVLNFEVNPNAMESFIRGRVLDQQTTTAPDGNVIVSEGNRPLKATSFKGTLLDQSQHDDMLLWLENEDSGTVSYLDDHLGRRWVVYITDFQPVPKGTQQHPWRHEYTVNLVIMAAPTARPVP